MAHTQRRVPAGNEVSQSRFVIHYSASGMRKFFLATSIGLLFFATACTGPAPQYQNEITVKEIMDSVVDPNADFVWQSVSTAETIKGTEEKAPRTDEEWREVRRHTVAIMEATNMLQVPGRRVARPGEKADDPRIEEPPEVIQTLINSDRATWYENARGLYAAAALLLQAVDAKNVRGVMDAGDKLDKACEACHLKYWYPNQAAILKQMGPSGGSVRVRP